MQRVSKLLSQLSGSSEEGPAEGRYLVQAVHSQKVMHIPNQSKQNSVRIQQGFPDGSDFELWDVSKSADGVNFQLMNVGSGLVLDVSGGDRRDGAILIQYGRHGGANQQFGIKRAGTSSDTFWIEASYTGKAVTVVGGSEKDDADIAQYEYAGHAYQQFKFIPWSAKVEAPLRNGRYMIQSKTAGRALSVPSSSREDETQLVVESQKEKNTQKWDVAKDDTGYYTISSKFNGKVMQVSSRSGSDAIVQGSLSGGPKQLFKVTAVGGPIGRQYTIAPKSSRWAVAVEGNSTEEGAKLYQEKYTGEDGQKFAFLPTF